MKTVVTYLRSGHFGRVSLTLEGAGAPQRALIERSTFIVTFPYVSLRSMGGAIQATPAQLRQLGFDVAEPTPIPFEAYTEQVAYKRGPYDYRIVTLLGTQQELVIRQPIFQRITGVSDHASFGSVSVTRDMAVEIGFILPSIETEEAAYAAS